MAAVPGLRSPYVKVGRLVFFGRMLDKIRLHAEGRLPPEYVSNLGDRLPLFGDGRCCRFLRIGYPELRDQTLAPAADQDVLAWAESTGGPRTDEECEVWNGFMMKLGWRDSAAPRLRQRQTQAGLEGKPIETMFDLMDYDEGREPAATHPWDARGATVVVLTGVAGSGKTTIGLRLAAALGWNFRDADEFHSAANIAKMSSGQPLEERDRAPWLAAIRAHIDTCLVRGESAVVTCSALRESYREILVGTSAQVRLVFLHGGYDLILRRMQERQGHFMRPELLRSQFETLEQPKSALMVDVDRSPEAIVTEIRQAFAL